MKHIQIILGLILFATVSTFAQSPRIKLNQITKDTVKGSVLISSPSDSGMVYSRDFYIAYGADTVLILYGDTITGGGGLSSVLSDGVTITGDGTTGNELKVDTSVIATIKALNDSLATVSASTEADGVTITGDGSVGNPLKVDTATVISTIQGLIDTLAARGYLTAEVDGLVSNEGSLTVGAGTASTSVISSNTSGSTDVTLEAGSNITLSESGNTITIASSGGGGTIPVDTFVTIAGTETITGAKTFTNTFTQSGGDANFDSGTLYVDESTNRVGIGTSSPSAPLDIRYSSGFNGLNVESNQNGVHGMVLRNNDTGASARTGITFYNGSGGGDYFGFYINGKNYNGVSGWSDRFTVQSGTGVTNGLLFYSDLGGIQLSANGTNTPDLYVQDATGNVGIGTSSPSYPLEMGSGAHVTTGGVWTDASDIKLKENINYYYPYGLNEIINLKPTVFDYINGEKNSLGFIAQDVFEVIPEAISSTIDENGNETMGIKMVSITATLVKAIQEQQTEIDQLKTLITDLTNRLIILENK